MKVMVIPSSEFNRRFKRLAKKYRQGGNRQRLRQLHQVVGERGEEVSFLNSGVICDCSALSLGSAKNSGGEERRVCLFGHTLNDYIDGKGLKAISVNLLNRISFIRVVITVFVLAEVLEQVFLAP